MREKRTWFKRGKQGGLAEAAAQEEGVRGEPETRQGRAGEELWVPAPNLSSPGMGCQQVWESRGCS